MKIGVVVVRWLQTRPFRVVALRTAEWRIDLVVARETISHLRHVGVSHMFRGVDAAMTREAWVRGIEVRADVAGIRYVRLVVDRRGNRRRHVPQFQMLRMAEMRQRCGAGRANRATVVARLAHRGIRQ